MPANSGNEFIDALSLSWKWQNPALTYYIDNSGGAWNLVERTALRAAFDAWESVSGLTFTQTANSATAELSEALFTNAGSPGSLGVHSTWVTEPTNSVVSIGNHNGPLGGQYNDAGFGWDEGSSVNSGLNVGGTGYVTILHEIGHAIGLDHTHSDDADDPAKFPGVDGNPQTDTGDNALNQDVYTVMSYVDGVTSKGINGGAHQDYYGFVGGPMAFDIATIQFLYGANLATNTGNNTYVIPDANVSGTYFTSIWDAGGIDEIVYNGSKNNTINLNSATLQNEIGGGGFMSKANGVFGGFTIAGDYTNALANVNGETGVIIENARGGSGIDTIIGNGVDNSLYGNAGSDSLSGGGGNDNLYGGTGADGHLGGDGFDYARYDDANYGNLKVSLQVPQAVNTGAAAGDTYDSIEGLIMGAGNDWAYGDGADNHLYGGGGNDNLFGSHGADHHSGGAGFDYARYDDASYASFRVSMVAPSFNTGVAAGDTFDSTIEGLILGGGNDWGIGNAGNNYIYGNSGNDNLFGSIGGDYLHGGVGFDYARFDDASYAGLTASLNDQSINTGVAAGDTYVLLEGLIMTGNDDFAQGDAGNNYLYGLGGRDRIDGMGGSDVLEGGENNDTYVFRAGYGNDVIGTKFEGGTGLQVGGGDVIEIGGFGSAFDSFAEVLGASSQQGNNVLIDFGGGDQLLLSNFSISNFAADDVVFV